MIQHRLSLYLLGIFIGLLFCPSATLAQSNKTICVYFDERGKPHQVQNYRQVPARFRAKAKCQALSLAAPQDIELKGSVRREIVSSALGPIELRWPRKVEMLFGRNPLRATVEAARVVSRVLRKSNFPPEIQRMNVPWKIVFMDESLPETQIPRQLISNCHPGWMTPPSNIYIVAQRVAQGCSNQSRGARVADSTLAKVLVHELGHAVEFNILKHHFGGSRMRAEGFATWFTRYAAGSSSMLAQRQITKDEFDRARAHKKRFPGSFLFDGSGQAYARASMYQEAIVKRHGVSGLMKVYQRMKTDNLAFIPAVKAAFGWSDSRIEKEIDKLLGIS